ncbi:MAG TPA: zf-HC2 domain-containing protein [Actinomycetota bacterium]
MSSTDFSCRELVELLTAYLDGALEPSQQTRLGTHLQNCDGCTDALEQFRTTIEITGRLTEDQVAAPEREAVREAFRRWRAERT